MGEKTAKVSTNKVQNSNQEKGSCDKKIQACNRKLPKPCFNKNVFETSQTAKFCCECAWPTNKRRRLLQSSRSKRRLLDHLRSPALKRFSESSKRPPEPS